jgi:hypothetical protein
MLRRNTESRLAMAGAKNLPFAIVAEVISTLARPD